MSVGQAGASWDVMLHDAIHGDGIVAAYQPVVDLSRGTVVGYEALARFRGFESTSPEEWFAAARKLGVADQLEAAALTAAFVRRSDLPRDCFLAVNVSPDQLGCSMVEKVLDQQGDLTGVVLELTEQYPIASYESLEPRLDRYRARGALLAIDDAGSGYAGLQHLIQLRPGIIKVDRELICGIDQNETKRALLEMLGSFADRTDCWLLAEGIERLEELETITQLGVPLAQGYLLARPASPWADVDPGLTSRLESRSRRTPEGTLRDILESNASALRLDQAAEAMTVNSAIEIVVLLDSHDRPMGIANRRSASMGLTCDAMRINVATPVTEAGRRAITRPSESRFHPIVCTDNAGRYLGIVRMERIVEQLTKSTDNANQ